jgi:glycosyltransferase involved in cell wall biosynthesis
MGIKVTHVVLSMDTGGMERVVLSLVREGLKLGQEVQVLCVEHAGTLAPEVERLGARVVALNKEPGLKLRALSECRKVLRSSRPDVLHAHQIGALFYTGYAARSLGVSAIVHTEHGKHFEDVPRSTKWMAKAAASSAKRIFCVSQDIATAMEAYGIAPASKIRYLANGIETGRYVSTDGGAAGRASMGIPAGAPVIGTVANLREVKRQDVLVRGFARVRAAERGEAHLLLVGDGPLRGDLERLAKELGVADRVHFAGHQSNPELFLAAMNIFSLTSRSEGMPLSILEAWAAGLPVVASRVGGLPELIEEGRTGLMFESGNDEALGVLFTELVRDAARARVMGEAGRELVRRRYDVSVMAGRYQECYMELLQGRTGGTRLAG